MGNQDKVKTKEFTYYRFIKLLLQILANKCLLTWPVNFTLFLKISSSLAAKMLNSVHQLAAYFVRLSFGTGQEAYRGFIKERKAAAANGRQQKTDEC